IQWLVIIYIRHLWNEIEPTVAKESGHVERLPAHVTFDYGYRIISNIVTIIKLYVKRFHHRIVDTDIFLRSATGQHDIDEAAQFNNQVLATWRHIVNFGYDNIFFVVEHTHLYPCLIRKKQEVWQR